MVELAPSILSADFARLAEQIQAAERGGGTVIHVDVMDGHFVPNITIGPPVVASLRKATKLPLDCHLMIENPDEFIPALADAGANWVSVHYEACRHLHRTLELIAQHGMQPAVVINPATRVEVLLEILPMVHHVLVMSVNPGFGGQRFIPFSLDKIRRLCELREELRLNYRIEVDGGVAQDTLARVVEAGADLLVAGNAVFGRGDPEENARNLLHEARRAAGESQTPRPAAVRMNRGLATVAANTKNGAARSRKTEENATSFQPLENRRPPAAPGKRNRLLKVK
ncbi:MAG: ribulose-phosphate 3-epimerase [Acidobacteriaceae bacterium]